jgi:hypothetical protein
MAERERLEIIREAMDAAAKLQKVGLEGFREIKALLAETESSPIFREASRPHLDKAIRISSDIEWKYKYNEGELKKYLRAFRLKPTENRYLALNEKDEKVELPDHFFIMPENMMREMREEFAQAVIKSRAGLAEDGILRGMNLPPKRPAPLVEVTDVAED